VSGAETRRGKLKVRRPFTEREVAVIEALASCTFVPGHPHKRFARDMGFVVKHSREVGITEKQAAYLTKLAWRYRRQMPANLAYPMIENDEGIINGFEVVP
jgi:hypothetical protein